ncbi:MAG TPA: hydrogenase maturation nickel metallochaperone HypA [Armatimonadota bacterium]|jgi:hydrogenase nickel insertion protein HypA
MHEYGIVQSLVTEALKQLQDQGVEKVNRIVFRRGSAFSEEALRQTFEAQSAGTVLEGAELVVDVVNLEYHCSCGNEAIVNADDLMGHMYVCPACGAVREIEEAHDIELLEIVGEGAGPEGTS